MGNGTLNARAIMTTMIGASRWVSRNEHRSVRPQKWRVIAVVVVTREQQQKSPRNKAIPNANRCIIDRTLDIFYLNVSFIGYKMLIYVWLEDQRKRNLVNGLFWDRQLNKGN